MKGVSPVASLNLLSGNAITLHVMKDTPALSGGFNAATVKLSDILGLQDLKAKKPYPVAERRP